MSVASIGSDFCGSVRLYIPQHGAWYADVVMLGAVDLAGSATLTIGSLSCVGTVTEVGTRGEQTFARIVGGAGAWGTQLRAKAYHNDAGVKAKLIAEDAARECGETLETITDQTRVGDYYVRRMGPASRALEAAFGTSWHVGMDGVTRIGERPEHTPEDDVYTVVDVQPADRVVTLAMDDVAAVRIGSVLSAGLDESLTIREIEIRVDAESAVVVAWCGGDDSTTDRISTALRTLHQREAARTLWGLWRYRVSEMDGDRVKLQAISAAAGLPDVLPVDMYPGLAGAHATLTPGAEVLVSFVEGSPTLPVIVQYVGKGGPGHEPATLTLDATSEIKLGAAASDFVALAAKVLTELNSIKTAFDTHTHPFVATGAASPTSAPTAPMTTPSSVAAALVKAE